MTGLDWTIIVAYAAGLIAVGWWVGLRQKTSVDYYLGGRRIGWLPIGLSTMATQLGAISFISAPAFVALRPGGGMIWLGYELAVPLAMIGLMAIVIPALHGHQVISIYEVLERRYDVRVRVAVSLVFQISRGLATGVTIYAAAIVIAVTTGIPLWMTIVLTGVVAVVYDIFGGIRMVILSDSIQMLILLIGIAIVGWVALEAVGGWSVMISQVDPQRLKALDFSTHGLGDGGEYGFWPLLIGGFFLYLSYYGADQSQVQRELAARTLDASKGSLLFNGLGRFPIVLAYCTVGLILGVYVDQHPEFLAGLPAGNVDYMVPMFIRDQLAPGLTGFLFVAIIAAAMSSLDSAINSLSAATLEDVVKTWHRRPLDPAVEMKLSKGITLFWGLFCVGFAFKVGDISPTVLESINKIGSAFYGPVFAIFLLGMIWRRGTAIGALTGLVIGVGFNLLLWIAVPQVSWLWWNLFGFILACCAIFLLGDRTRAPGISRPEEAEPDRPAWRRTYVLLVGFFVLILLLTALLPRMYGSS